MKLAITQIVLGMIISLATAFVIAWDPTTFHIRVRLPDSSNFQTIFNPDRLEMVAACLAVLVLLLGIIVLGFGIIQLVRKVHTYYSGSQLPGLKKTDMKLALTQVVLGLLVTVSTVLVSAWGFPTSYFYELPDGHGGGVFFTPGPQFITAEIISLLTFIPSLAVLICGTIQFFKARSLVGITNESALTKTTSLDVD